MLAKHKKIIGIVLGAIICLGLVIFGVSKLTSHGRVGEKVERATAGTVKQAKKEQAIQYPDPKFQKPEGKKVVYLTFDDGPSQNTAKILEILNLYHVKGTFFVTGQDKKYNYLIKRAYDEGNTIALHTYSHQYQIYASKKTYYADLNKVAKIVKSEIGFVPKYVRFPGGSSNTISANYHPGIMTELTKDLGRKGYRYYDWNCSSGDARGNNIPAQTLIRNATSCHADKINILFHDAAAKDTTAVALPSVIEYYKALGYQFCPISVQSAQIHHHVFN